MFAAPFVVVPGAPARAAGLPVRRAFAGKPLRCVQAPRQKLSVPSLPGSPTRSGAPASFHASAKPGFPDEYRRTIWLLEGVRPATRPQLPRDVTSADVIVVGAGIAGLTLAYELLKKGVKDVLVLEARSVSGGMTGRTTAHLMTSWDDRYFEAEKELGRERTRVLAESLVGAVDRIEAIVKEAGIQCDFSRLPGHLFLGEGQGEEILRRELDAATRAGIKGLQLERYTDTTAVRGFGRVLTFPGQGQFDPVKYTDGLARAVERLGGRIFEGTRVAHARGGCVATGDGRELSAGAVALCTNSPIVREPLLHMKQSPYRTYAVAGRVPRGSVPPALFWSTEDPYTYVRLQPTPAFDYIITGGGDHRSGHTPEDPGEEHPWAALYDPKHLKIDTSSLPDLVEHTAATAGGYAGAVLPRPPFSARSLDPGSGALVHDPLPTAAFKDEAGATHVHSAICPHLGCAVEYNPVEKTFDCPCHGSIFDADGAVLNGPATSSLHPAPFSHGADAPAPPPSAPNAPPPKKETL
eukprot:tig00000383_g24714.t1